MHDPELSPIGGNWQSKQDPARISEILTEVKIIWEHFPEMRLGQLLHNASVIASEDVFVDSFYTEDDQILKGLRLMNTMKV